MSAGVWAAPGRVNIIGEHTDYNNGFALPIALRLGVTCAVSLRGDDVVSVASLGHEPDRASASIGALADRENAPGWTRYPFGVVHEFAKRGYPVEGADLLLEGDVPVGAGLSSSAAVTCAVAVALRDLFAPDVPDEELIDIARAAENDYVGAPTGTLDQTASVLCAQGHALLVDFGAGAHVHVPFDLVEFGLALMVVDTKTAHRHVDGEYALRRQQCARAAHDLGVASLRDVADAQRLDALDPLLRRRARHVLGENERVLTVAHILRTGRDTRVIGPILTAGHASLRDDFEVSSAQLDAAVEAACEAGAHGARMVGGGFGGSVIALVDEGSVGAVADAVESRFRAEGFGLPQAFTTLASAGARRLA
ncbi:MAG: galactokinase [Segniliparus sp.]|uniref:galactokinase n=1 Tax=Segniliparus sp. TaxID=2804064 RepID=UPI003F329472